MTKVKYVFVILVYRNYSDLEECITSISEKVNDSKIIVVNAHYDNETSNTIKLICDRYECVFITIENKGYSFGNNRGIEYASKHYNYEYLVVSNPDIVIKAFSEEKLKKLGSCSIVAPKIVAANGRHQNPMMVKKSRLSDWFIYKGLKKEKKYLFYSGIAVSKIQRFFFFLFPKKHIRRVFAAHGSFVIFTRKALEIFNDSPYDEKMFLFAEESVIAEKARNKKIKTYYYPFIDIMHKEDGSMKLVDFSVNNELVKSNLYFYETYIKNK